MYLLRRLLPIGLVLLLSGCSSLGYYSQLARGQFDLLERRVPIARLIADPATDATLRSRLQLTQAARAFASDALDLPRNGSYTDYADLGRSYVLQNVFTTPEFSLEAITHCFPIAGCVAYRGYYDSEAAQAEVARQKALGNDVYLGTTQAYSTLGWFDDPVLNTMLRWDDDDLAGTIFHELTHQKLYVKNDTSFNESLATFVEQEGMRQWRAARGLPPGESRHTQRADQFTELVLAARARLKTLYASGLPAEAMRSRKAEEIERLRGDYRALRDGAWNGYAGYDPWMNAEINNAKLLPFGLYHRWVPAFAALYEQNRRDWPAFFAAAKALAAQPPEQRTRALDALLAPAADAHA
jgi:predicted aminopeptidase